MKYPDCINCSKYSKRKDKCRSGKNCITNNGKPSKFKSIPIKL